MSALEVIPAPQGGWALCFRGRAGMVALFESEEVARKVASRWNWFEELSVSEVAGLHGLCEQEAEMSLRGGGTYGRARAERWGRIARGFGEGL